MSKYILLLAILFGSLNIYSAVDFELEAEIELDSPSLIQFYDGLSLHIFTEGIDVNENGQFDEGEDIKPKWYYIAKSGGEFFSNDVAEFEFNQFENESKVTVDQLNKKAYINSGEEVFAVDLINRTIEKISTLTGITDITFVDEFDGYLACLQKIEGKDNLLIYSFRSNAIAKVIALESGPTSISSGMIEDINYVFTTYNDARAIGYQFGDASFFEFSERTYALPLDYEIIYYTGESFTAVNETQMFGKAYQLTNYDEDFFQINIGINFKTNGIVNFQDGFFITADNKESAFLRSNIEYKESGPYEYYQRNLPVNWNDEFVCVYEPEFESTSIYTLIETNTINDYTLIDVGAQPVESHYNPEKGILHVFCLGQDLNFNGEEDDGDEKPSWWVISNINGQWISEKVFDFEFGSLRFPFRPAFDDENDLLYIPHPDKISLYDLLDYTLIEDNIWSGNSVAVNLAGPHLLITVSEGINQKGRVVVFDELNNVELQEIESDINPQKSVYFNYDSKFWFAILNNGDFSTNESTLQYAVLPHMQQPTLKTIEVGETANDLLFKDGKIYIAANGSHELYTLDILTDEVEVSNLGTNGFDGPREVELFEDELGESVILTSYSGDLIRSGNGLDEIIPFDDNYRIEHLEIIENDNDADVVSHAISAPFFADYSSNNQIAIFGEIETSVRNFNSSEVNQLKVFPSPAKGNFTIKIEGEIKKYQAQIFDINGQLRFSIEANGNRLDLNTNNLNLESGNYFVKVITDKDTYGIKFNVQN